MQAIKSAVDYDIGRIRSFLRIKGKVFLYVDSLNDEGDRITYTDDENARIRL